MNKCIFMGRVVRTPEIRYTQGTNPTAVAKYTLAVDRKFQREGEPSADFLDFVAYGKAGEFAEKYFKKGTKLAVTARVQTRNYIHKDGYKVYVTEFIVEDQEFAESKAAAGQADPEPSPDGNGFMMLPDGLEGDLPFH